MRVIGITGRSGCGKSTVTAVLSAAGCPCVDADEIARQVLLPESSCIRELQNAFGSDIVKADGSLDRHLLADRAFASKEGTARLTAITHPEILRRIDTKIEEAKAAGHTLFFVDGAVIIGTPFEKKCDALLVVTTPYEQSVARICRRDGITPEMACRRLDAQLPESALLEKASYVLHNTSTQAALQDETKILLQKLKQQNERGHKAR